MFPYEFPYEYMDVIFPGHSIALTSSTPVVMGSARRVVVGAGSHELTVCIISIIGIINIIGIIRIIRIIRAINIWL